MQENEQRHPEQQDEKWYPEMAVGKDGFQHINLQAHEKAIFACEMVCVDDTR